MEGMFEVQEEFLDADLGFILEQVDTQSVQQLLFLAGEQLADGEDAQATVDGEDALAAVLLDTGIEGSKPTQRHLILDMQQSLVKRLTVQFARR